MNKANHNIPYKRILNSLLKYVNMSYSFHYSYKFHNDYNDYNDDDNGDDDRKEKKTRSVLYLISVHCLFIHLEIMTYLDQYHELS